MKAVGQIALFLIKVVALVVLGLFFLLSLATGKE